MVTWRPAPPKKAGREIRLPSGWNLGILDQKVHKSVALDFQIGTPPLELCFLLRGIISHEIKRGAKTIYKGANRSGTSSLSALPQTHGRIFVPADQEIVIVSILVSPYALKNFFELEETGIRATPLAKLGRGTEMPFLQTCKVTAEIETVLWQVLNCPMTGKMAEMYLEGKMLELTSLVLFRELAGILPKPKPRISASDRDKIYQARDILRSRMDDPPGLMELARQVGLNRNKLNQGFKENFGQTVFSWLRKERLEKARLLLRSGELNITQVAGSLGFSSHSHFTHLFQKRYGITPYCFKGLYRSP